MNYPVLVEDRYTRFFFAGRTRWRRAICVSRQQSQFIVVARLRKKITKKKKKLFHNTRLQNFSPTDSTLLNIFLLAMSFGCHFVNCSFNMGSKWWTQFLSPMKIWDRRPSPPILRIGAKYQWWLLSLPLFIHVGICARQRVQTLEHTESTSTAVITLPSTMNSVNQNSLVMRLSQRCRTSPAVNAVEEPLNILSWSSVPSLSSSWLCLCHRPAEAATPGVALPYTCSKRSCTVIQLLSVSTQRPLSLLSYTHLYLCHFRINCGAAISRPLENDRKYSMTSVMWLFRRNRNARW